MSGESCLFLLGGLMSGESCILLLGGLISGVVCFFLLGGLMSWELFLCRRMSFDSSVLCTTLHGSLRSSL